MLKFIFKKLLIYIETSACTKNIIFGFYNLNMSEQKPTAHPTIVLISKIISTVFNPLTSLVLYFLYHSYHNLDTQAALREFLPILIFIIIPISAWLLWNVKNGNYSNMDVSDRKQRNSLYVFISAVMVVYLLYKYFFGNVADYTMLFLFVLIIMMQISNFFIKSSMHTSLNIFAAALFFTINPTIGIFWLILSMIVAVTRIILKRHTIPEVIMGAFLALIVSFAYLFVNIQNL